MRKALQIFVILFFCFCASVAPLSVAVVEHYCPMFKPEKIMIYQRDKDRWVEELKSNGFLIGSLILFELSCFFSCIGALVLLEPNKQ